MGLSFGMGFAAINSGNNLLYLVFGLTLSAIMVSGILSEANLRRVVVERVTPPHLFVGGAALVGLRVRNGKRRLPAFGVDVRELFPRDWVRAGTSQRRAYVLHLPPGGEAEVFLRLEAGRRGAMPSAGLRVSTRFPFGFFEKSRLLPAPTRYLVLPAAAEGAGQGAAPRGGGVDERLGGVGAGDEFHGLRDMRPGDDARSIAWKVSARRENLVVREHERPATREVWVCVPNVTTFAEGAPERLEAAIERAAALAARYVDAGFAVGVWTTEGALEPAVGEGALVGVFEHLARLPVRRVAGSLAGLPVLARVAGDADGGRGAPAPGGPRVRPERVAVATADQVAAGAEVSADRLVLVDLPGDQARGSQARAEGPPPVGTADAGRPVVPSGGGA